LGGRLFALLLAFGLSTAILTAPHSSEAMLGESADTLESDRRALSAVRSAITAHRAYTVHEFDSDATRVREYISPTGIVFGIAWKGLSHPDLTHLLGSYSGEYLEALRQTPRRQGLRRLQVRTNRVVVEKWGHMRNLQGRAYAPELVPSGVGVDEIT
jgi:hypothetical protein